MKRQLYISVLTVIIYSLFTGIVITGGAAAAGDQVGVAGIENLTETAREAYYQGELKASLEGYSKILNSRPEDFLALANSWFLNKELGNLDSALVHNQKIVELKPESYYWRFQLGSILYQLSKYEESRKLLTDLYLEIKDGNKRENSLTAREESLLYYYLGGSYARTDETEKAEFFLQQGVEKMPQLALNQIALGELYQRKGEYQKATGAYQDALKRDNSLSFLHPRLASLAELSAEPEKAYYYWRNSRITGEEAEQARERLSLLRENYPELEEQYQEEREREYREAELIEVLPVSGGEEIPVKRVGLVEKTGAVSFRTGTSFQLLSGQSGEVVFRGKAGEEWTVSRSDSTFFLKEGIQREVSPADKVKNSENREKPGGDENIRELKTGGPLILKLTDRKHTTMIYNMSYGQGYFWAGQEDRQYRGGFELLPVDEGHFTLINLVNLEEYLFSVVPAEMPAWWPEEALKAQAIAARTYALRSDGRHNDYDLCDSVHCAVYKGAGNENKKSNQAVLDTLGEAALYQDRIISAVFTSNSGGYSESSADIWGYEHPYLQGANNLLSGDYQFPLEPYRLAELLIEEPDSYSGEALYAGYNKYRWIKPIDREYFLEQFRLEGLQNIIPLGRTTGGTVKKVILQGRDKEGQPAEITISKDLIRGRLGGLKSNRFVVDKIYNSSGDIEEVIFYGSGFGHSVGMDQTGSAGMARSGKSYQEIIEHFYQGTELKKMY